MSHNTTTQPVSTPIEYQAISNRRNRWWWPLALALCYAIWCSSVDWLLWEYWDRHGYKGQVNPFSVTLLPTCLSIVLMRYLAEFYWPRAATGMANVVVFSVSCAVVGFLSNRALNADSRSSHFKRVHIWTVVLCWLAWFPMPIEFSLRFQFIHWKVGDTVRAINRIHK
jgi:hypothetical protein